jgi:hypothetical protein
MSAPTSRLIRQAKPRQTVRRDPGKVTAYDQAQAALEIALYLHNFGSASMFAWICAGMPLRQDDRGSLPINGDERLVDPRQPDDFERVPTDRRGKARPTRLGRSADGVPFMGALRSVDNRRGRQRECPDHRGDAQLGRP